MWWHIILTILSGLGWVLAAIFGAGADIVALLPG